MTGHLMRPSPSKGTHQCPLLARSGHRASSVPPAVSDLARWNCQGPLLLNATEAIAWTTEAGSLDVVRMNTSSVLSPGRDQEYGTDFRVSVFGPAWLLSSSLASSDGGLDATSDLNPRWAATTSAWRA